jgi:hypothetical protein
MLNTIYFRCWPEGQNNRNALSRIHVLQSQLTARAGDHGQLSGDLQALIEEWAIDCNQISCTR